MLQASAVDVVVKEVDVVGWRLQPIVSPHVVVKHCVVVVVIVSVVTSKTEHAAEQVVTVTVPQELVEDVLGLVIGGDVIVGEVSAGGVSGGEGVVKGGPLGGPVGNVNVIGGPVGGNVSVIPGKPGNVSIRGDSPAGNVSVSGGPAEGSVIVGGGPPGGDVGGGGFPVGGITMGGTKDVVEEVSVEVGCVDDVSVAVIVPFDDVSVELVSIDDVSVDSVVMLDDVESSGVVNTIELVGLDWPTLDSELDDALEDVLVPVVGRGLWVVEPIVGLDDVESSVEDGTFELDESNVPTLESELDDILDVDVDKELCATESLVKLVDVEPGVDVNVLELTELDCWVAESELGNVPDVVVAMEFDVVDIPVLVESVMEVRELELVKPDCSVLVWVSDDVLVTAVDVALEVLGPSIFVELKGVDSGVEVEETELEPRD